MAQNTNQFAEIPHYALYAYFDELGKHYLTDKSASSGAQFGQFSNVIFGKKSFINGTGFLDGNGDYQREHTYSNIQECRIATPGHHVIVNGGQGTELYVEKPSYGYREVRVKPKWGSKGTDSNGFLFDLVESDITRPGVGKQLLDMYLENRGIDIPVLYLEVNAGPSYSIIDDIVTNGSIEVDFLEQEYEYDTVSTVNIAKSEKNKSYAFKNYRKSKIVFSEEASLEPNDKFFFRKDSFFFDGFEKTLANLGSTEKKSTVLYDKGNHRDFINPNVLFTYFGIGQSIHGDNTSGQIQHYSMKNFMINALPPNDLGPKNYTLLGETYDRVYEETYNMERNITRLLDPEEVSKQYLPYQAAYYDVELSSRLSEERQREFIRNLPVLLKKKGTQSSLAVIGRTLIGSANTVTFFERGHEAKEKIVLAASSFALGIEMEPEPEPEGIIGKPGGLPAEFIGTGFQNPLNLINYAVLYCGGEPGSLSASIFLYWDRERIYKHTFDKKYPLEAGKAQISKFTQDIKPGTYFTGLEEIQFEVVKGQSSDVTEDGIVVEYALGRKLLDADNSDVADKEMLADSIERFFSTTTSLKKFNYANMNELLEGFPMMGNYYGQITIENNVTTVNVFGNSDTTPLQTKSETADGLTFNFIRNYCYKKNNYFGFGGYSYKFDTLIKTEPTQKGMTSYGSIHRIPIDYSLTNGFKKPEIITGTEFSVNSIMYSFTEPKYFVKLTANKEKIHESILEIFGNNEVILAEKCPPDIKTFNEMKFGGQNYVADISTKTLTGRFFAGPRFGDRLDDMSGAEMDSISAGNIITYYYKVKVKNLQLK